MRVFGNGKTGPYDNTDTTNYPYGRTKNDVSPGDLSGTPIAAENIDDLYQIAVELLRLASITPDGNPEKKAASQVVTALKALFCQVANVAKLPVGWGIVSSAGNLVTSSGLTVESLALAPDDVSTLRSFYLDFDSADDLVVQCFPMGSVSSKVVHAYHDNSTGVYSNASDGTRFGNVGISNTANSAVTNLSFGYIVYKKTGLY